MFILDLIEGITSFISDLERLKRYKASTIIAIVVIFIAVVIGFVLLPTH